MSSDIPHTLPDEEQTRATSQLDSATTLQRFIVGFRADPSPGTMARLLDEGAHMVAPLTTIDAAVVIGPNALRAMVATWDEVAYVELDGKSHFFNYQTEGQTGEGAVKRGDSPLPRGFTGRNVTIAVVDLGIDADHPDLVGQVVQHLHFEAMWTLEGLAPETARDALAENSPGINRIISTHGLAVAGVLGGTGAIDSRMQGVAPGVTLVDFNVCCSVLVPQVFGVANDIAGCCNLPVWGSDHLMAYDYMIRHKDDAKYPGGIKIATNQWGFLPGEPYPRQALTDILRKAINEGITLVFSAGNFGPEENTVAEPQSLIDELIVIGASCPAIDACGLGEMPGYSSRGPQVDLVAPGDGIWSTSSNHRSDPEQPYGYREFGGTSAAAPYTAGVVAMMLEANPQLTPEQIENILKDTAQDFGVPGYDTNWGWGEVRAFAAVKVALEMAAHQQELHCLLCRD